MDHIQAQLKRIAEGKENFPDGYVPVLERFSDGDLAHLNLAIKPHFRIVWRKEGSAK